MVMWMMWTLACGTSTPEAPSSFQGLEVPVRGSDASRSSKNGRLVHEVGGTTVDVRYGRPAAKGRTIWGGLVPYGQVWRAGADEATTVAFPDDVRVNRAPLEAGVYSLFVTPFDNEWGVHFNRDAEQWGAGEYDRARDALRLAVKPTPVEPVEVLTFVGTPEGIALQWGDRQVELRIVKEPDPITEPRR